MSKQSVNPCGQCPYRKDSLKGWLGASSFNPAEFLTQLELPLLHPCHKQVNWDEAGKDEIASAPVCKGAIQFAKNTCKRLYDSPYEKLRQSIDRDDANVFSARHEFINHHKQHS